VTREDHADGRRFYLIDGARYPSVTTILKAINKPALVPWAANKERAAVSEAAADLYAEWAAQTVRPQLPRAAYLSTLLAKLGPVRAHERLLEQAGDLGSEIHKLIEWVLRVRLRAEAGPEPVVSAEAQHGFKVFDQWAESVQLKPVLIERVVFSKLHGYAGTLDLMARINVNRGRQLVTLDFKTGKAVYPEALLQNAAYRVAAREMGYPEMGGLIVRLPKVIGDPVMEIKPVPSVIDLFPVFLGVKTVWQWSDAQEAARRSDARAVRAPRAPRAPRVAAAASRVVPFPAAAATR
jgi:hypothetical protein